MNLKGINSDHIGVLASTACILHCLATPLLFITQAQTSTITLEVPLTWKFINYLLLTISLAAVLRSVKNSSSSYVKFFLIFSWSFLAFFIINESFEVFHIPEIFTYSAAGVLSFFHIYNSKYCNCKDDECCIH